MSVREPRPVCWTKDEYYRLCEEGWFNGRSVQLIGGEIIEMPAQKNWHALGIGFTDNVLRAAFGPNFWVRIQMSLDLSPLSVPDPDLAVVAGAIGTHRTVNNPTTALLVVEVSETTLAYDRNVKSSLYAAARISDYWILNLVDRQLEVYRDPAPDAAAPHGFRYQGRTILDAGDRVSPLALPGASIAVADLLP
jgi:Uma2 family endonuclease